MIPQRVIIYPKDVENITGKKYQAARNLLQKIRKKLGKQPDDMVVISEFCKETGIPVEVVQPFLK